MDDLIVLILSIIFIIAGVFGQTKKKPVPPGTPVNVPPAGDIFRDTVRPKRVQSQTVEADEYKPPIVEGGRVDRFHTPGMIIKREFASNLQQPLVVVEEFKDKKRKPFPLKKAVIYSEILKRKYF